MMTKKIVFLGDSLTEWGNWEESFPEYSVHNLGIAGERTDQIIERLTPLKSIQPKVLFVMMGINDLGNGNSTESIIENWNRFFSFSFSALPNSKIVIQSLLPYNAKLWPNQNLSIDLILLINRELELLAEQFNATFINLFDLFTGEFNQLNLSFTNDGLHLNDHGYRVWEKELRLHIYD